MSERKNENAFDRLDRKVGMAWGHFWGTVLAIASATITINALSHDNFTLFDFWPILLIAAGLAWASRACFKSDEGMLSILSDVGVSGRKK